MNITPYDLARLCNRSYATATHSVNEVDALVIEYEHFTVIAMRGTEASNLWPWAEDISFWESISNWWDVVRDLRVIPWRNEFGWSHAGFQKGADAWVDEFADQLNPIKPIVICGHSLGAGLAPHIALLLKFLGFTVESVVMFGEPRGLLSSSRKEFKLSGIPAQSFKNGGDVICTIPPWGKHAVKQTKIGRRTWRPSFKDHDITEYMAVLKQTGLSNG